MTGVSKEDVLTWFQDLNASQRLELICALLDHSLPFELRFLGSVIENLGRKDFHVLRDAECKANSLHSNEATQDPATILKFLAEGPSIGAISVQAGNVGGSSSSTSANPTMQAANAGDVSVTRPGSSLKSDLKGDGSKTTPDSVPVENGITSKSTSAGGNVVSPDAKANERSTGRLNHKGDGISDEENDSKRDVWLYDQTKRRKLILYLSLLQATNHDSANSYYLLLSDVEDLMDKELDWLDDLEEMNQDEILLLYTISSQHPAFNFEQRSLLSTVLNRFREYLPRYSKSYVQGFPNSSSPLPNQILNHLYIPPQQFDKGVIYPVYCPAAQLVQQPIPSSQSTNPQPGTATDAVRPIAYSLNSYPYPSYQVFMPAPNHGSVNHHPQQFPTHPFPQNATAPHLSMQSPVVPPNGLPIQVTPIPPSTLPLPSQSPVGIGAVASQKSHPTGNPSGSTQSHQSSISTPTRTSSMASAVTAYQSQENSLDGDSEGSCAWDSPESSPFESPPQSLTPSRSQSPRTGTQNSKNVHMSSLNLSSTSSTISCHGPTHTITNSTSQPCLKADGLPGLHQVSVQQTRPVHKSQSTQERKSRTSSTVVSGHNSGGQVSNNLPCTSAASSPSQLPMTNHPPPSSLANVAATTATSSAPSIASPVSRTQQCSSSCNHPINPANPGQCPNVNTPAQASPLCSTVNASTPAVTTGDSAPNSLSISLGNKIPSTASHSSVSGNVSAGSSITTSSSANVLNSVNTSAYGNSVVLNPVSSSPTYPLVTLQHHATSHNNPLATVVASNSYTGCIESFYNGNSSTGLIAATTGYGNVLKGSPSSMHSQSSQGRQSKSNASSNNPQQLQNTVIVHQAPIPSQQQHIMQQLMQQQLVNQMQSSSGQAVNAVTHSMNTPLLAYGHPSGLTSHGGHVSYSGYPSSGGMNFGGLGGPGYRPGSQISMIGRSNAFIPSHPGQMVNNPLAMKQDMRNHVTTGHNSLRQKNPSVGMPNQNTPKRRTTSTAPNNSSISGSILSSAGNSLNQNNGKEESSDIGDRTNNVMVVSANPTKSQQDNRGRIYHHPNSKYSNGPLVPDRNATSYSSGQASTNQLINSPSGNPGLSLHNVQSKSEDIVPSDSGMSEYNVSTSQVSPYPSVYGHPGNAYIVPNGYLPYYQNPIGGTGAGPQGPPPTEILMNPGHMHPQYPYTSYPFTIPQSNYNIGLSKQNMSASNSVGKDSSKGGADVSKVMTSMNDLSFGRPGPPSNSQSSGTAITVSSSGIVPMPSHSPLSNHSGRRGVILEVGGQASGTEFQGPNLAALENALMPPLDDPLDVNCRPRKISCYNCGSNNHVGPECKEASMEEMTRKQYRLNYGGPSADSKDGD